MSGGEAAVVFFMFGGALYVLRPVATALAKRIAGDVPVRRPDDDVSESVLADLRDLREDVSALAERVDFTERLLARQRDAARLPPA
jgi:hypothetical protein